MCSVCVSVCLSVYCATCRVARRRPPPSKNPHTKRVLLSLFPARASDIARIRNTGRSGVGTKERTKAENNSYTKIRRGRFSVCVASREEKEERGEGGGGGRGGRGGVLLLPPLPHPTNRLLDCLTHYQKNPPSSCDSLTHTLTHHPPGTTITCLYEAFHESSREREGRPGVKKAGGRERERMCVSGRGHRAAGVARAPHFL